MGDYIDRGFDSKLVADWLIERAGSDKVTLLRGNHEVMMLQARQDSRSRMNWLQFGGAETMMSYEKATGGMAWGAVPPEHWAFYEDTLLPWFETDTHIFVHAAVDPGMTLDRQPDSIIYWERFDEQAPHFSGKTVVCGHTIQRSGRPTSVGHAICIDTGVYKDGGWLTCLDVDSGQYWQASEDGETRDGKL